MRRMTSKYARPGMVLGLPVYDNFGEMLLPQETKLDKNHIISMLENEISEIFIYDSRVADVVVARLFSPQSEGFLANNFRYLVKQNINGSGIDKDSVDRVLIAIYKLVKDMHLNMLGDLNVSCHILRKYYVYLQPVKTAGLSIVIGHILKLSDDELATIGMAALLKDIGLPIDIINSVDSIAEGGSPRMCQHPLIGCKMLVQNRLTTNLVAEAVLQHHECWNGSGYPKGLKGEEISQYARIIALADTFVDLLAERPSGIKYMPHEAIEYIMAGSGDQFDPELVESFVREVPSYSTGLTVKLNKGEMGIVSNPKQGFIARPVVRICSTEEEGILEQPYDVDLSDVENQSKLITEVLGYD